jgi:CheY-like chemotaxis protein
MNSAPDSLAVTLKSSELTTDNDSQLSQVSRGSFCPRVLFVDDEPEILAGIRRALSADAYDISTALSADCALARLWQETYDVVVADERMPGMLGSELLAIIAREFPLMGRILLTGHATVHSAARAVNKGGIIRLLLKPCAPAALREAIEAALRATPHDRRVRVGSPRPHAPPETASRPCARLPAIGQRSRARAQLAAPGTQASPERPDTSSALPGSGLVLRAQKVVELRTERLFGYEMASRLEPGDSKVRSIGTLVESSGQYLMLPALDRWALRTVIRWAVEQRDLLDGERLTVSLNLSAQSLTEHTHCFTFPHRATRIGTGEKFTQR